MANNVDLVIGSEAIKQVENLISKLSIADAEILKISESSRLASKNIQTIGTPSGLNNSVATNAKLNAELEKQSKIVNELHTKLAQKAEQSRLAEIRLQKAREKAFDSFDRNAKKEQAINAKNETSYQRIQNSVNVLTKTYQDLQIRKELGGNLTAKEEKQLSSLTTRINTYQTALKSTDATIQKNQRNVGNYASGWNGLGNSINQLTREAPAFAVSMNTGFLALSNNIPILFDEISKLKNENIALAKSGEPTKSIFKQLGTALFSWGTALSIGVTLITLYGGKLIEFISANLKGAESLKSLGENQKLLNDTLAQSSGKYAEEKVNIEVLYKTAINLNASYKDRKKAVDELQQLYPFYFKNLSDEEIMVGNAKNQYLLLSEAIVTTAKARASEEILQKRESERLVIEQEQLNKTMKLYGDLAKAKGTSTLLLGGGSVAGAGTQVVQETESQQKERLRKEIQKLRNESVAQRELWAKEDSFFIEKIAKGNAVEDTLKPAEKAKVIKAKKEKEARREDIQGLELHIKKIGTLVDEVNQQIARLETEKIVANADELPTVNFQLKQMRLLKKQLNDIPTVDFTIQVPVKQEDIDKVKELTEGVKNYLNSFSSEFMSNSGFSETFSLLNGEIEGFGKNFAVTFNAIAESAQEAFNFINNASQQKFDAEKQRLQSQYDLALQFAGGSTVAQEKLAADLEKRKKEIANRENKAKKKQAIFNIAIDTAQGVISALASTPPNIPLSIAIGILGATQLALVASQKVPQYAKGTDNHAGGLMLVNDGLGNNFREKVITPDGKEFTPQGRNVLIDAPKGTKVLTHEQQIQQMLSERGVSMNMQSTNNGMTEIQMDRVMSKHFSKIQVSQTTIDKNGFNIWQNKNGNITKTHNNRLSGQGFKV